MGKTDTPIVVLLHTTLSGLCKQNLPILAEIERTNKFLRFGQCDMDESPELMENLGISTEPPTLIFFCKGRAIGKLDENIFSHDIRDFFKKKYANSELIQGFFAHS
ncbi:MAG: hypothetical protein GC195_07155 [Nostoc sp. RI_552]|nr:hypothetical protein [Nostoc sp. RI_552]